MTWDLEKKKKKKREHPMYPVQYLHNNTTIRVPDLGPTAKLVGTMAQDSVQKGKKKKNTQIHMLLKIRSSLKNISTFAKMGREKLEIMFNRKR